MTLITNYMMKNLKGMCVPNPDPNPDFGTQLHNCLVNTHLILVGGSDKTEALVCPASLPFYPNFCFHK